MDNLTKSKVALGTILAFLYDRGIQTGSFSGEDVGLERDFVPFVTQGFLWLVSEKLVHASRIQISNNGELSAIYATLTSRGFEILGAELIEQKKSVGSSLVDLTKQGASHAASATISEIVGIVIGSAAKQFMGPHT